MRRGLSGQVLLIDDPVVADNKGSNTSDSVFSRGSHKSKSADHDAFDYEIHLAESTGGKALLDRPRDLLADRTVPLTVFVLPRQTVLLAGSADNALRVLEEANPELQDFYARLMRAVASPVIREGEWRLCEWSGWPDNRSFENLVAWTWTKDRECSLIVINLSEHTVQGRVHVRWPEFRNGKAILSDALSGSTYERDGNDMLAEGLYVELPPWRQHFFQCSV